MRTKPTRRGALIVSLDLELHWGLRDKQAVSDDILGARNAVARILTLFAEHRIHATWATVGFLFATSRDEIRELIPNVLPRYLAGWRSPYATIEAIGWSEEDDPYHYGASLIGAIASVPDQEIGCHTFSHYYCLEPERSGEAFSADLAAAVRIAGRRGHSLKSLVFPRNQYDNEHVSLLPAHGIICYRGSQRSWMYQPATRDSPVKRGVRLLDAYIPLSGMNGAMPSGSTVDVPASRFLRPVNRRLGALERIRLARIQCEMLSAALRGLDYHLWWHPHNFGRELNLNLKFLRKILLYFGELKDRFGMESLTMLEAAARARRSQRPILQTTAKGYEIGDRGSAPETKHPGVPEP